MLVAELNAPTLTDGLFDDEDETLSLTARFSAAVRKIASLKISDLAHRLAAGMLKRANDQNKRQTKAAYKTAFGIDLTGILGDAPVRDDLRTALTDNVNLIKSIHTDFIHDIGNVVFENLSKGGRHENLIKTIQERGKVTESRARLIARDQTAKLNAALTKTRTEALGVDLYEWGGAGDERERKTHSALNGKTCKYSDPTVYSDDGGKTWKKRKSIGGFEGHPGEDYQCRCVALPVVKWD